MWLASRLAADHDTSAFDSGQPALDQWLRREALRAQQQDVARTYVWTAPDSPVVVAYYSLCPTQVAAASVSRSVAGGHSVVPGILLARLAVHRDLQGRGLGSQLLRDALEVCVASSRIGAGRLIVVDPIDAAARAFYLHHNFIDTRAGDRMVMKMATARNALGLA